MLTRRRWSASSSSGGDRRVRVFRAPGRIALNPHCEHQGAWVPYGTHRREILLVVGARSDDLFTLSNLDPSHRRASQLRFQSGFYGASTPELDRIVDLVTPLPEVLGAGLMGAGGGGCVLILARAGQEALSQVTATLREGYYEPLGLPVAVEPWHPTAPAGELTFDAAAVEPPGLEPVLAEEKAASWLAA